MKTRIQLRQRATKLRAVLLTATVGALLLSGNAAAQWTVIDPTHIKTQLAEFAKEAARWGEQGRQWYKEYQQFMQEYNSFLSSIDNMQSMFSMSPGAEMQEVPDDFNVAELCGEQGGGGVSGMLGSVVGIDPRGDLYAQNYRYCASAQIMRNRQYNEAVRYLRDTVPQMQAELDRAGNQFVGSGKTQGDMSAYSAKMEKVKGDIATANNRFEAQMLAYNTYVKTQESNQATLTRTAMRGGSGLKSNIKQMADVAAVFTALCGGGKCSTED